MSIFNFSVEILQYVLFTLSDRYKIARTGCGWFLQFCYW